MSSKHDDCTQCQEWELCPFHPAEPAPRAAPAAPNDNGRLQQAVDEQDFAVEMYNEAYAPRPRAPVAPAIRGPEPKLRLLGQDDPEVSDDMIYLDERTGGLVAVPSSTATPNSVKVFR